MYPTYHNNDVVFTTQISNIERFDNIVFKTPDGKNLIKRVIGFGGESIAYINNELYIDGKIVSEPYKAQLGTFGYTEDFNTLMLYRDKLEKGCYFVLGDNRNNSTDSRSPAIGCIKKEDVLGEVKFKLWGENW